MIPPRCGHVKGAILTGQRERAVERVDARAQPVEGGGVGAHLQRLVDEVGDLLDVGFSTMPRVVTAGVPMRMPLGFMGCRCRRGWRSC
jgi:hypothetical protein